MPTAATAATTPTEREAYPQTLFLTEALASDLRAIVAEATANGARVTIVTVYPPTDPTRTGDHDPTPFSAEQLAAHYAVRPATIRAWCREGRFPGAERMGRSWRIPRAAVRDRRPPGLPPHPDRMPLSRDQAEPSDRPESARPTPAPPTQDARTRRHAPKTDGPTITRPIDRGFDRTSLSDWRRAR